MPQDSNKNVLEDQEMQVKEAGRSGGGLLKVIVNFIKGIAGAIFDMPQQGQSGDRDKRYKKEDLIQPESVLQDEWLRLNSQKIGQDTQKNPEDLSPESKLEVKEAAKGLKEGVQKPDAGNRSVGESITPGETLSGKEEITPEGRGI